MRLQKKQILILSVIIFFISIGFAFLSSNLSILGLGKFKPNKWDVHFENIVVGEMVNSQTTKEPVINSEGNQFDFGVNLNNPGSSYVLYADIVNDGTIDVMLDTIKLHGVDDNLSNIISGKISYSDYKEIKSNDLLKSNCKETIRIEINYLDPDSLSDLPNNDGSLELSVTMNYLQDNGDSTLIKHPVCIRARKLHKDYCNFDDSDRYCSSFGYTENGSMGTRNIVYGSLGISSELNFGDAFDCDVNGDGIYNSENERFYYITDLGNNYVSLIFYNNINVDVPSDDMFQYNAVKDNNFYGPTELVNKLPSSEQWKNVKLSTTNRDIYDPYNVVKVSNFSYSDRVARLLTFSEALNACGLSVNNLRNLYLNKCVFLLEETAFTRSNSKSYWLENVSVAGQARYIQGSNGLLDSYFVTNKSGVRPVIEVLKSDIDY